ncbi:MAG: hypothetical protein DCF20_18050 [Pseudanabaena sp.]|nr:MAG: hypothetical protein DCF20_18050 [Pseudanabaena sp.]
MNRLRRPLQDKRMSVIQAKLSIGEPNDKYEQEADATASKVVQQINSTPQDQSIQREESMEEEDEELQMKPISTIQREESMEEDEELQMKSLVQRRENLGGGQASTDLESSIQSVRGGGRSLDAGLQQSMGQAMGADFSGVKVHTDSQSDQLNQSIQAKAFTTGQDVFFRQGAYDSSSKGGQELIAHELTHVVQQSQGRVKPTMQMKGGVPVNDAEEPEQGGVMEYTTKSPSDGQTGWPSKTIQRQPDDHFLREMQKRRAAVRGITMKEAGEEEGGAGDTLDKRQAQDPRYQIALSNIGGAASTREAQEMGETEAPVSNKLVNSGRLEGRLAIKNQLGQQSDPVGAVIAERERRLGLESFADGNLLAEVKPHKRELGNLLTVQMLNPQAFPKLEHVQTLLGMRLIENNLLRAKWAAGILGSLSIPDLQTLVHLDGNGQISTYQQLKKLFAIGGNIDANLSMQAAAIDERDIVEFNKKAGVTKQEILGCWNTLNNTIVDPSKKQQVMRSFRIATNAKKADLEKLVNNFSQLNDRTTVDSKIVSSLLSVGLLRAKGNIYTSGKQGIGSSWVFEYAGGGRLIPEWHVHYQADGSKTKVSGAGWKNEKFGVGEKTFGEAEPLRKALQNAGVWQEPKI